MDNVNTITFCREDFESENEMWNDIMLTLKILSRKYIAVFRCDEPSLGIYVIEYNYADSNLGGPLPVWVNPEDRNF